MLVTCLSVMKMFISCYLSVIKMLNSCYLSVMKILIFCYVSTTTIGGQVRYLSPDKIYKTMPGDFKCKDGLADAHDYDR